MNEREKREHIKMHEAMNCLRNEIEQFKGREKSREAKGAFVSANEGLHLFLSLANTKFEISPANLFSLDFSLFSFPTNHGWKKGCVCAMKEQKHLPTSIPHGSMII